MYRLQLLATGMQRHSEKSEGAVELCIAIYILHIDHKSVSMRTARELIGWMYGLYGVYFLIDNDSEVNGFKHEIIH